MLSKTTLFFLLLRLATAALLLYFSAHILANKGSEKEGVVRVSLNVGLFRRDFLMPSQEITSQAAAIKTAAGAAGPVTVLRSAIPTIVNGAASRVTAAVSSVVDDATGRIGEILPTGWSV